MKEDINKIIELFIQAGLAKYETKFRELIKPSIRLKTTSVHEESIPVGQCKIGGRPDLPAHFIWPTYELYHMSFIAQINLSMLDPDVLRTFNLPTEGMLYFFLSSNPEDMGDQDIVKVYYADSSQQLIRTEIPDGVHEEAVFNSCTVESIVEWTVPGSETYEISRVLGLGWNQNREDFDKYWEIFLENYRAFFKNDKPPFHRFLGNHNPVQSGFIEGGYQLLFQIDSDENVGTMWGDTGMIYFWIKPEELRDRNFANVIATVECC